MKFLKYIFLIVLAGGNLIAARGQVADTTELFEILRQKDSVLFRAAFDTCDPDTMAGLFSIDFEFYHDKGGLTEGRETFLRPMYEQCADKGESWVQPSKRILLEDSLKVFPLFRDGKLYGAIQEGRHRFEFLNQNKQYQKGDIARFIHLWVLEDGQWKIRRELSYDHLPANSYTLN